MGKKIVRVTMNNKNIGLKIIMIIIAIYLIINSVYDIKRIKATKELKEELTTLSQREIFHYEPYCEEYETLNYSVLMYNITFLELRYKEIGKEKHKEYYDLGSEIITEEVYLNWKRNNVVVRVNNVFYGQETKSTGRCKKYGLVNRWELIFRLKNEVKQ